MNESAVERRCKSCGKLLLDERLPFCKRCILTGRNRAVQGFGIAAGLFTAYMSAKSMIDSDTDNGSDEDAESEGVDDSDY